ncbi:MAG: 2-hydroxyacid dehydrogenase, partial [Candidatus Sericytochromatia bacterium]|nr:2-hydroxyacid dehydrogenase [Candidatus Sericytochromatia bacterium]
LVLFDCHAYEQRSFQAAAAAHVHRLTYLPVRLSRETATLARGFQGVCCFVNDTLDRAVLEILANGGTQVVAMRCAGFNNVDLQAASALGLVVLRVPAYSPHAVAEHAVALLLCLNRKIHKAYARVREGNFSLNGLMGFDLHGKTVGVIGVGRIGHCFARIMAGFGCRVLAFDPHPDPRVADGVHYVSLEDLLSESDIISLHAPLTPDTRHLINRESLAKMRRGVVLINTSRGPLVDTQALIEALKQGQVAAAGLDVYEREAGIFFEDWSDTGLQDDTLARLLSMPQVLVTGHQAFLTETALQNIAEVTLLNLDAFERGAPLENAVTPASVLPPRI